jgi:hypothetical protein
VTAKPKIQQTEVPMELATDLMLAGNISPGENFSYLWFSIAIE